MIDLDELGEEVRKERSKRGRSALFDNLRDMEPDDELLAIINRVEKELEDKD